MSDIDKLLAQFESGALLRPSSDVLNLVDLARAIGTLTGVGGLAMTAGAGRLVEMIGPSEHLVVVLADGLGMSLVETLPAGDFLRMHLVTELRTVFPSSTATALTALATGEWPNRHGVTGQWTYLPAIQTAAALLPFAARNGGRSLIERGVTIDQAFPVAPLIQRMRAEPLALYPEPIATSRSSAYFSGGRRHGGYRRLADAIDLTTRRIASADGPTYTYIYLPTIDEESHRYGASHPAVRLLVSEVEREVGRLRRQLGGGCRVIVTADHGLLDTPVVSRHWLRPTSEIFRALTCLPSGDSRVMYLHVRPGLVDRVRLHLRARYGDRFFVLTVDEAEQVELFGPGVLSAEARARLGDLIVISAGADVFEYVANGSLDRLMAITAHHSGLTPAEMRVPLIVA